MAMNFSLMKRMQSRNVKNIEDDASVITFESLVMTAATTETYEKVKTHGGMRMNGFPELKKLRRCPLKWRFLVVWMWL